MPLIPSSCLLCSALLSSPLLVLCLLSLYPAVLDGASFPHPTLLCSALLSLYPPSSTALPSACPLVDGDALRLAYNDTSYTNAPHHTLASIAVQNLAAHADRSDDQR
ncbi:hypothetical protein BJ912DRAFT_997972 [Pholiota molesta]|nr:hypothetical protein BJ912DRAFT_997972 [Pholiota molesta]